MKARRLLACLFLSQSPLLFATTPASVQGPYFRTYVSNTGSDTLAGPVTTCGAIFTPCLTFAGAAANTLPGGEIDALTSGDFGPVNITQPLTIDGGSNIAAISAATLSCAGHPSAAICVNAGTGAAVTLRNLSLNVSAGGTAINFEGGAYLRVENVLVDGGASFGVLLATGSASLDHVRIQNANNAVYTVGSALASINNSTISSNGTAVQAFGVVNIDNTLLQFNSAAVSINGGTVRLSNTTITDNTTGLTAIGGVGAIISYVNNRIYGNGTNGAPTLSVYQR